MYILKLFWCFFIPTKRLRVVCDRTDSETLEGDHLVVVLFCPDRDIRGRISPPLFSFQSDEIDYVFRHGEVERSSPRVHLKER